LYTVKELKEIGKLEQKKEEVEELEDDVLGKYADFDPEKW
jgi:hypothetical protein